MSSSLNTFELKYRIAEAGPEWDSLSAQELRCRQAHPNWGERVEVLYYVRATEQCNPVLDTAIVPSNQQKQIDTQLKIN